MDQIGEIRQLIEGDGMLKVSTVHGICGICGGSICASSKPGQALFKGDPLGYGEGPMDGVQLGVNVYATVVADICPRKKARVGRHIPLPFLLEKLEPGRPLSLYWGRLNAALSGRNAAIGLHFGRVRTVVCHEVVPVFYDPVVIVEAEAVSVGRGAGGQEA